ncbi:MAG: hypothetical protein II007_07325 [Gammaproteobacteria bacterium]|nr:hypothetical protein [Gammaproteobacteria bacterium]
MAGTVELPENATFSRQRWLRCPLLILALAGCGGGGGSGEPPSREVPALEWQLPQARMDGTPMDAAEIAEIEIWYQQEGGDKPLLLTLVAGDATRYVPDELSAGRYRFHLVAIDMNWLRSEPSAQRELVVP